MKRTTVVVAFAGLALAGLAHAQPGGMQEKNVAAGTVHRATGKVTRVDAAAGSVTIAHGPVASIKWPAMTMSFKVKDRKMLGKLKSGEKADFSFVQSGRDYTITDIE
jgi:Cu/Ag efflux protein CusF